MVRTRSLSAEMMVDDFKQCDVLISLFHVDRMGEVKKLGELLGGGRGGGEEEEIMNRKSEKGTFECAEVLLTEVHQTALFFFLTCGWGRVWGVCPGPLWQDAAASVTRPTVFLLITFTAWANSLSSLQAPCCITKTVSVEGCK